ncbi:hypothetical protein R7J54_13380 [Acinetobacter baumannii]|uniref:hypothetical protein n=1 Tax=Acinetobacter calcoaceticus/baumannii complex TaxID=909768 RepID=UPI0002BB3882|nr:MULTISPECIES: hypothetical protein [Acinetobacter calcoaceticus/baumannii complex]EJB8466970.1 hypothetical protein [Acinetobacter baumannii]KAA8929451.1 hypothetical protein DLI67_06505 [Acinetobacter baumannii]KAA8932055.1 hypothetical protein DLI68_12220 [Acinetobacter baumannii]MBU3815687.1 hypothetical protein [Acinetobacter baumannii]MCG6639156.1 hypothetical protein [Acinetobacter baumannii]
MGYFIFGLIIGWLICKSYTENKIAEECERLGGFYVGKKTYLCNQIVDHSQNKSTPEAIIEAEKGARDEIQ